MAWSVCGLVALLAVTQLATKNGVEAGGISGLELEEHTDTLFDVVRRNNPDQILELLEAGADLHGTGPDGRTALMQAASWIPCKDLAIPVLLDAGARINQVETHG